MISLISKQDAYNKKEIEEKLYLMLRDLNTLNKLKDSSVLIKPNCTGVFQPKRGITTHPVVLEALIEVLLQNHAKPVIGESSSVGIDTFAAYERTGIKEVAEKYNVKLIDFKKSRYRKFNIDNGLIIKQISLPEEILDKNYVISLAKLKTNYVSTISCSIKNMKGLLQDRQKKEFHKVGLAAALADFYSLIKDKCIGIVDGILGSELYEPKKANVLIASSDLLDCDAACSYVIGINPMEVEHLRLAYKNGFDWRIYSNIVQIPFRSRVELRDMAKEFGVEIYGEPCSSCVGALYYSLKKIRPELLKGLRIGVGKCSSDSDIHYGKCTGRNGNYVDGCPPHACDLVKVLERGK